MCLLLFVIELCITHSSDFFLLDATVVSLYIPTMLFHCTFLLCCFIVHSYYVVSLYIPTMLFHCTFLLCCFIVHSYYVVSLYIPTMLFHCTFLLCCLIVHSYLLTPLCTTFLVSKESFYLLFSSFVTNLTLFLFCPIHHSHFPLLHLFSIPLRITAFYF